jgi:hypothetical protein
MKKKTVEHKTKKPTSAKGPKATGTTPIRQKKEVPESHDERIDEDFPGYPHHPAHDPDRHNGSAHAFERTEESGYDTEEGYDDGSFED